MENHIQEQGNADQFIDLIKTHHRSVERYINSLVRDKEQARDIIQECYLNALEHGHQLRNPDSFFPWIRKIALRIHLQKSSRTHEDALFIEESHGTESFSPEALIEKKEGGTIIHNSFNRLGREDRKIILLFHVFGYSHRDISEKFGITVSAAKKRLERARRKLEAELGDVMRASIGSGLRGNDSLFNTNLEATFEKASWIGELSLIEAMLLDGVDVDEKDMTGRTLLHYAALRGNEEAVDLLLRYGAEKSIRDKSGMTAEEIAFRSRNFSIREKLRQGKRR